MSQWLCHECSSPCPLTGMYSLGNTSILLWYKERQSIICSPPGSSRRWEGMKREWKLISWFSNSFETDYFHDSFIYDFHDSCLFK